MDFGDRKSFAIEIGEIERSPGKCDVSAQFRFWIGGTPIGDWDDRISLKASIVYMKVFCRYSDYRIVPSCATMSAEEVFEKLYQGFFGHDYTVSAPVVPNLRDRHHMDDIGMGAVVDKYGIVVVRPSASGQRVIVKDLARSAIIIDITLPDGVIEAAGADYIAWGEHEIGQEV
jgi:hypothetical protein